MGTTLGILTGLIVFLASALVGVIATNGANNPGIARYQDSAAAGGTAPKGSELMAGSYTAVDLNGDGKLTQVELNRLAKLPPPKPKTKVTQRTIRRDAATAPAN